MRMDIEQIKKEFGLKIRSFRLNNGYTQEKFCELINLEQPNLSNIENGKNFPDITTLCTLIEKTGIEPNYLFEFINGDTKLSNIDYEIMNMLLNLSLDEKIKIKNIIEIMNNN